MMSISVAVVQCKCAAGCCSPSTAQRAWTQDSGSGVR